MSYFPRTPNGPRDNNYAFNTTGSSNHNANAQNHNRDAFNTTNYSYGIFFVNYTPNEIEEMARRIPGTLSPPFLAAPPNPDSTLREATIHQHQGWLQVTDGIQSPNMGMQAALPISHTIPSTYPFPGSSLPSAIVSPMNDPEKEIIIAVMGHSVAGKTHFIREVSGISDIKVSDTGYSWTSKVQSYSFPHKRTKITLVDTPGFKFGNLNINEYEVLSEISAWTSSSYTQGRLLSGIIYLHDIRHTYEILWDTHLMMFQKLCGLFALQNVLFTTTHWSEDNRADKESCEIYLRDHCGWGELVTKGAAIKRFLGTRESGLELINQLMKKEPKPLLIQRQMVDENMTLEETDVGKCME